MKGSKETESIRYLLLIHLTNQIILFSVKSWALSRVSDPHREEEIWWWKEIKYSHEIIFQRVQLGLLFELNLQPLDRFWGLLVLRPEFLDLVLRLASEGGQGLVQLRHLLWQVTSLQIANTEHLWIYNIWSYVEWIFLGRQLSKWNRIPLYHPEDKLIFWTFLFMRYS